MVELNRLEYNYSLKEIMRNKDTKNWKDTMPKIRKYDILKYTTSSEDDRYFRDKRLYRGHKDTYQTIQTGTISPDSV